MNNTQKEALERLEKTLHDLKTPLTNIKTFSHLLEKQSKARNEVNLSKYAAKIQKNLDRTTDLLNLFADTMREMIKNPQKR